MITTCSADIRLWPVRPKPQPDELLSSWLVRIAARNHLKLHTFCAGVWGRRKNLWNRDIDKLCDEEILRTLSAGTGVSIDRARATTLEAYEGIAYANHNSSGNTRWIRPLGIYHRLHTQSGLQYCPACLRSSTLPYYRRCWRLGMITRCDEHGCRMLEHCPSCGHGVNFHRREMGRKSADPDGAIEKCYHCNADLSQAEAEAAPAASAALHQQIMDGLRTGCMRAPDGTMVKSPAYYDVLHQLVKLLLSRRSRGFGQAVAKAMGSQPVATSATRALMEQLPVAVRDRLICQAGWLLADWPDRFVRICSNNRIWSAWVLRDMLEVPEWFADVVADQLYVPGAGSGAGLARVSTLP